MPSSTRYGNGPNGDTPTNPTDGCDGNTSKLSGRDVGCSTENLTTNQSICSTPLIRPSNGTGNSKGMPTRTTRPGNSTSRSDLASKWLKTSNNDDSSCAYGKNRTDYARFATRKSPNSLAGTIITLCGERMVAATVQKTECFSIPIAIVKFTVLVYLL